MPKLDIARTTTIKAHAEKIYNVVSDFTKWTEWSPWLIMERDAEVIVAEDGQSYSWNGKRVGSGEMKITSENPNHRIDYDLTFLTPWKSHAKIAFDLKENGDETEVTWIMKSSLPFFMFWMTKMMTAFMNSDYDRGLMMLKEYCEEGKVSSDLEMKGINHYSGSKYIGIKRKTTIDKVGPDMSADIEKLSAWFKENNVEIASTPFSIYHDWNMIKQTAEYTSAFPVKEFPSNVPSDFLTGEIPELDVYTIRHKGPYRYLGNMWGLGMNLQQNKVFKASKKQHPFETYVNMPGEVPDEELVTEVHFAVK